MHIIDIIKLIAYFLLLVVCAYTDYKNGKIYNKNLLRFLLAYVIIYCIEYIFTILTKKENLTLLNAKLIKNLSGFLIAFVIGFIFYILGVFKGGDAKLIAIVGLTTMGKEDLFIRLATILIVAGVVALYVMIKNKIFVKRFRRIFLYIKGMILTRSFEKYTTDDDNIKFPFAVYILLGEIISFLNILLRG